MRFIEIKPELIDVSYWVLRKFNRYELKNPNSAAPGVDGFTLRTIPVVEVKLVTSFSKPILLNGEKTQTLETDNQVFTGDTLSSAFRSSSIFSTLEQEAQTKFATYMARYIGALGTIENATLAATQTSEGSDTSHLSSEEREARKRLSKAERRLINLFKKVSEVDMPEFTPAYLENNPDEILPLKALTWMNE